VKGRKRVAIGKRERIVKNLFDESLRNAEWVSIDNSQELKRGGSNLKSID